MKFLLKERNFLNLGFPFGSLQRQLSLCCQNFFLNLLEVHDRERLQIFLLHKLQFSKFFPYRTMLLSKFEMLLINGSISLMSLNFEIISFCASFNLFFLKYKILYDSFRASLASVGKPCL